MALTAADKAFIADAIASALVSAPAKAEAKAPTFATKADIEAGGGFPCTASEPCSRTLRTLKRSQSHGVDAGGHEPRA